MREGGEVRRLFLLGRYLYQGFLLICSHITFVMVYYFYFLCFGSRRNKFSSFGAETQIQIQYSENDIRISHNLLSPSPSLSQRRLYLFLLEPKHRKRNNTLSQMRLQSRWGRVFFLFSSTPNLQIRSSIFFFFLIGI